MSNLRPELNARRRVLRERLGENTRYVQVEAPSDARYQRAARDLAELRDVESAIATFQLADAQLEVAAAQRQVAKEQKAANDQAAAAHSQLEELNF